MIARLRAVARSWPRLTGAVLAVLLFAAYLGVVRPARVWSASRVAYPVFASIDTAQSRSLQLVRTAERPEAVFALPADVEAPDEIGRLVQQPNVAQWVPPAGVLFVLPAMFLVGVFPTRPYWLYLLGYHLAIGAVSFGVFALGVGWVDAAFELYRFSRTYVTEAVSLAVPLLLWLRGRAADGASGEVVEPSGGA